MPFEALYIAHFQGVYRYLLSLTRDEHLAEELTQETFYRAMKGFSRYEPRGSDFTWLCQIGKNAYVDHCRKGKPKPLPETLHAEGDALSQVLAGEERLSLHAALHSLPEPYREIFTLRVFAQMSYGELSRLFGHSESWARVMFYRAKKKLMDIMKEDDHA